MTPKMFGKIMIVAVGNLVGISITDILLYYAIGCLILLPFYLFFIIYLCKKKPQYIQKLNVRIDKILNIETPNNNQKNKTEKETKAEDKSETKKETDEENAKKETEEKESKSVEEINEEMNISNMTLKVEDTYKCNITEWDRQHIEGNNFTWKSTDDFIVSIDKMSGKLKANKVGECYIECGGTTFYFIKVLPTNPDWFATKILKIVLGNMDKVNITANFISNKIRDINEISRIISYSGNSENVENFSFEYNKRNEVIRVLVIIKKSDTIINDICNNLNEYMSSLTIDKKTNLSTKYWIHKSNNDGVETVDYNAFLKTGTDGKLYLGIGECWRIGANEQEISNNIEMIERSFYNLLPVSEVPKQLRTFAKSSRTYKQRTGSSTKKEIIEDVKENVTENENENVNRNEEVVKSNVNEEQDNTNYDYTPETGYESYDEDDGGAEEVIPGHEMEPDPFDDYSEPGEDDDEDSNN